MAALPMSRSARSHPDRYCPWSAKVVRDRGGRCSVNGRVKLESRNAQYRAESVELSEEKYGRPKSILCSLALLAALFAGALPAEAQQRTCFRQTGHCIGGRFAQYWQQNGGLRGVRLPADR